MDKKEKTIPKNIQQYLYAIMSEHGDLVLPAKLQGEIMADLFLSLNDLLVMNFINVLGDKKVIEYEKLLIDKRSQEEVDEFLMKNTDYKRVVKDTLESFRKAYLKNK